MNNKSRFAFTHGQKAILWISSFICLWQFLQVPAVVNALLDFYAAGVVPGTDIVLSPDTVLRLLFALLFSLAALLFYRKFKRRAASVGMPQEYTHAELYRICSLLYQRHVRYPADLAPPAARWRYRFQDVISRLPAQPAVQAVLMAGIILAKVLTAIGMATEYLARKAVILFSAAMMYAGMAIGSAAKFVWRQVEPSMRQFDRWLERRVNQSELGVVLISIARNMFRFSSSLWQRVTAVPDERTK